MEPEIIIDDFLELDGNHGGYVIPLDALLSKRAADVVRQELPRTDPTIELKNTLRFRPDAFRDAIEEIRKIYPGNRLESVTLRLNMFGARLTMPGYLDCTDWTLHETEADAREALADMYGED